MAKATVKTDSVMAEWFVNDMRSHCRVENDGIKVNNDREELAKRRKEKIEQLVGKDDVLLSMLRVTLSAWTGTKGQKQSYKRSWAKHYHAVHEHRQLEFKQDTPLITAFEPVTEKPWEEVVRDTLLEHGATQELVTATVRTMAKIRNDNAILLEETQQSIRAALRQEKARSVEELKRKQAELEKELAALA